MNKKLKNVFKNHRPIGVKLVQRKNRADFNANRSFITVMLFENDSQIKSKPLSLFVFFFTVACKRIFSKTHSVENRCGWTEKIHCLQARPCIFQPGNFTCWSSEGVKMLSTAPRHYRTRLAGLINSSAQVACKYRICQAGLHGNAHVSIQNTQAVLHGNALV